MNNPAADIAAEVRAMKQLADGLQVRIDQLQSRFDAGKTAGQEDKASTRPAIGQDQP